jgi:hypothetical protein
MRSLVPIPGNPWPHDMTITVQDTAQALMELLWVREAWNLHPAGDDLPPLLVDTPERVGSAVNDSAVEDSAVKGSAPRGSAPRGSAPRGSALKTSADVAEWKAAWPELWDAVLAHTATPQDPALFDALQSSPLGSAERAELIDRMVGPSWHDRFGQDALGPAFAEWHRTVIEQRMDLQRSLKRNPERAALNALIPSWKAGLTVVIAIPCRGEHSRRVGPHALLVTDTTRDDPARYPTALAVFRDA